MGVWLVENRTEFIRQNMGHSHHFYLAKLWKNIHISKIWRATGVKFCIWKVVFCSQRSETRFWSWAWNARFLEQNSCFLLAGAKLSFDGSWSPFFRRLLGCTEFACLDNFSKKKVENCSLEFVSHVFFCSPAKQEMKKGDRLQCSEELWNGLEFAVDKYVTMYIILFVIQSICLTIFHYKFMVCRSCECVQYAVTSMDFVPLLSFFQEFIIGWWNMNPLQVSAYGFRSNISTRPGLLVNCNPDSCWHIRPEKFEKRKDQ